MTTNKYISKFEDLVTSRADTRKGFISMALEKNYLAGPFIDEAKSLRILAKAYDNPNDLLTSAALRQGLISASGLSDKAINYLDEDDRTTAIKGLIDEFLVPAGVDFADELVYRYLLTKGDALGGKARNLAGALGERKFMRGMISLLKLSGVKYIWCDRDSRKWLPQLEDDAGVEKRVKGLAWTLNGQERLLLTNVGVPIIGKNVDLVLLNGGINDLAKGDTIIKVPNKYISLGELKGGVDPAGADEHWKTANSAIGRIRKSFSNIDLTPSTFFIGAAVETSMAKEIFHQLEEGLLSNAANLCNDDQLTDLCNWILNM